MGPSPERGSVWAYARSAVESPLLIDAPWEVWDGHSVSYDHVLRIGDLSVIPSVVAMTFGGETPAALRPAQGLLLQQPGLWDGRPYYKHQILHWFLLCSEAEGHWRLGPLPLDGNMTPPVLFVHSAAALPQQIDEPWHLVVKDPEQPLRLGHGAVRLTARGLPSAGAHVGGAAGAAAAALQQQPRHLLIEGLTAGEGVPNGVYRRMPEPVNQHVAYQKTDSPHPASLCSHRLASGA